MSSFTSELIVSPLKDGRRWKLCKKFTYHIGSKYSRHWVKVPKGFVTDFASSPFFVWSFIPSWGRWGKAAVLHDYMYQTNYKIPYLKTRRDADNIFREAMGVLGVDKVRLFLIYWSVRLFAGRAYKKGK